MRILSTLMGLWAAFSALPAIAQDAEHLGKPVDKGLGFQPAVTELSRDIQSLDNMINVIIFAIVAFVALLLVVCIVRFNRRANPSPASFTHNTPIEIAWTLFPILVLVFIGAFSLPVLFKQQEIPEGELYIKVTGHQWYWTYEYPEQELEFDSYMLGQPATIGDGDEGVTPYVLDDAMKAKLSEAGYNEDEFLLATDTRVVVPVDTVVVMGITADDVIHSWTIPAFGVKQDAVPGRLAQLWFEAEKEGVYFGQCSELCGKDHAYMPITVEVVSKEAFAAWTKAAAEELAANGTIPTAFDVASAE
ncbi:cytochrome c oxidase subunit II [Cognatishimia sp. 1_MG-2023]|uniref:cytochrome c oxidase subunit II n=1 Tax=Cognatishimia sp. 1_MG-2023 TaxID=3062642 RepID=UPI0026E40FF6|nr:cytochrome c oxidase subunit II [Cognatishimia sp. 1_MG-2023]MDO6725666.1 cytochrome c oxidase subunit II [Cognatishimia sp. 1_MG-2023]